MKNEADTAIHNTEKSLQEHRAKLNQQDITEIENEIAELKKVLAEQAIEPQILRDAIEKVKNASMKIGKAMYSQTQSGSTEQQGQQQGGEQGGQQGGQGGQEGGEQGGKENKQ